MKKINLFLSTLILALVALVAGGVTMAPVMQLKAMSLSTADAATAKHVELFDAQGRYQIRKTDLTYDKTYNFMGYDWHLVMVNGNVATFWMATPYAKTSFDSISHAGLGIYKDGSNIWTNGYTKTVWESTYTTDQPEGKVTLGESSIRTFLHNAAETMIDNTNYKDKVLAGYIEGNNQVNDDAKKEIEYLTFSRTAMNQIEQDNSVKNQLTAYYDLDSSDRLWLPSLSDLVQWGIWDKDTGTVAVGKENMVKWINTDNGYDAWLRNPSYKRSCEAVIISAEAKKVEGETEAQYIHYDNVAKENGVRPAIHLNITDIDSEAEESQKDISNNNSNKGNWFFNEDWLKALFLTVCIIGIVGIILVIVAVVVRNHKSKDNIGNVNDDDDEE